jgi:transposase
MAANHASKWTPEDKIRIVLESINTNIPMADLCRKYNVSPNAIYDWKEKFMEGGKLALTGGLKDPAKEKEAEIERLKKLIGELTIANDAMKKVLQGEGKK